MLLNTDEDLQVTRTPIDNSIYVERVLANSQNISQTLKLAKSAQLKWKKTTLNQRKKMCLAMVNAFIENSDEIALQLSYMMGRPIKYALSEVSGMAQRARHMINIAKDSLKTIKVASNKNITSYIKREPLGVVFVIAPWNYPYLTAINSIIPAIMAGNTVILKHSAQTPLCAEQFEKAFEQVNFPKGVFQYLHLSHGNTEVIIKQNQVDYVSFTGSVAGGKAIENACNGHFMGLGLELGGKDPAYVCDDADLKHAVETCIDGAFFNSGQSCCGIERIYVAEQIYDEFVKAAIVLVNQYKLGSPLDVDTTLGPMVNSKPADFVREQIHHAVIAGAKTHINPENFPLDKEGSAYLAPQILTNVDHSMDIMTKESFGPVVGIMKVRSDKQAIELMNDSEFGLTASVFTKDTDRAITIGEQLETGTFFMNRCDYLDPALAWTGVKNSGRGCTLSSLGYSALTRPKSFHLKTKI